MSFSPIELDEDAGEETVQKKEEEHNDTNGDELGTSEKTTIHEKTTVSDRALISDEDEAMADSDVCSLDVISSCQEQFFCFCINISSTGTITKAFIFAIYNRGSLGPYYECLIVFFRFAWL